MHDQAIQGGDLQPTTPNYPINPSKKPLKSGELPGPSQPIAAASHFLSLVDRVPEVTGLYVAERRYSEAELRHLESKLVATRQTVPLLGWFFELNCQRERPLASALVDNAYYSNDFELLAFDDTLWANELGYFFDIQDPASQKKNQTGPLCRASAIDVLMGYLGRQDVKAAIAARLSQM